MIPAIVAALGEVGTAEAVAGAATASASGEAGGAIGKLTERIKTLINPVKSAENTFHKLFDTINYLPSKILEVEQTISSTARNLTAALSAPLDMLTSFASSIGRFTGLSNPGGMRMLEFHQQNAMATIGNILQPILDSVTRSVEKVGDAFAKLKPAFEPMMRAAEEFIDIFGDEFIEAARAAAPLIHTLGEAFLGMAQAARELQPLMTQQLRMWEQLANGFRAMLGLKPVKAFDQDAKSDFAVGEPQFKGAEAIFNEQARNAVIASMSSAEKPKTTEGLLDGVITKLIELPKKIAEAIAREVLSVKVLEKGSVGGGAARAMGGGLVMETNH